MIELWSARRACSSFRATTSTRVERVAWFWSSRVIESEFALVRSSMRFTSDRIGATAVAMRLSTWGMIVAATRPSSPSRRPSTALSSPPSRAPIRDSTVERISARPSASPPAISARTEPRTVSLMFGSDVGDGPADELVDLAEAGRHLAAQRPGRGVELVGEAILEPVRQAVLERRELVRASARTVDRRSRIDVASGDELVGQARQPALEGRRIEQRPVGAVNRVRSASTPRSRSS